MIFFYQKPPPKQNYNTKHLHSVLPVVEEIVWLDVPMDDPKLMDVFQGFQQVVDVQTDLFVAQRPDDVLRNMLQFRYKS